MHRLRALVHTSVCAALVLLLGCASETARPGGTRLVVVADADPMLRLRAKSLRVQVNEAAPDTQAISSADGAWPRSVSIQKSVAANTRALSIQVSALDANGRALASVIKVIDRIPEENDARRLSVFLSLACADVAEACVARGETCGACGNCETQSVDVDSLPKLDASDPTAGHVWPRCESENGLDDGGLDAGELDGAEPDGGLPGEAGTPEDASGIPRDASASDGVVLRLEDDLRVVATESCLLLELTPGAALAAESELALSVQGALGGFFSDASCTSPVSDVVVGPSAGIVYFRPRLSAALVADTIRIEARLSTNVLGALSVELRRRAREVQVGLNFACAIFDDADTDGAVYCWGNSEDAQTGQSSAPPSFKITSSPSLVAGTTGQNVRNLSLGDRHGCVLVDGVARCWGRGEEGQLGSGGFGTSASAGSVQGLAGKTILSLGCSDHASCVLTTDHEAYCWGSMVWPGESPVGRSMKTTATKLSLSEPVSHLSIGSFHGCFASENAQPSPGQHVRCWGFDDFGQIGNDNGNDGTFSTPQPVTSLQQADAVEVVDLVGGGMTQCARVRTAGATTTPVVRCWGQNSQGPVIAAGAGNVWAPQSLAGLDTDIAQLDVGVWHACARFPQGARCWGQNATGELGRGDLTAVGPPGTLLSLPSPVEWIDAGRQGYERSTSCAVAMGLVYCWGSNLYGELAVSKDLRRFLTPSLVSGFGGDPVTQIALGASNLGFHHCASTADHTYCWGYSDVGGLGNGSSSAATSSSVPIEVPGILGSKALVTGDYASVCAVTRSTSDTSDKLYCWGGDPVDGTGIPKESPTSIPLPSGAIPTDVCRGYAHACTTVSGAPSSLYCWGYDTYGQLGDVADHGDAQTFPPVAAAVSGTATKVACARYVTCAVVDGGVQCWGDNDDESPATTPEDVVGFGPGARDDVIDVAVADRRACALTSGGSIYCWYPGAAPVLMLSSADALTGGGTQFCARDSGLIKCWAGYQGNTDGQVGNQLPSEEQVGPFTLTSLVSPSQVIGTGATDHGASCAVDSEGLKCWGSNGYRVMGGDAAFHTTRPVLTQSPVLP